MNLEITTLQLWPINAKNIIDGKGIDIKKLRHNFKNIIFPWNNDYDKERQLFNGQIQEKPLFIIYPNNEKEIKRIYQLMKRYFLTIRIVSGRHSPILTQPDIFIIMSKFTSIKLDNNILKAGSHYTQGQINNYLFNINSHYHFPGVKPNHPGSSYAFACGSAASVGITGISGVGGIGTLRRTLGLLIDTIISYKIVIPIGKTLIASKDDNSDLFFALRGGNGANFGMITEISYNIPIVKNVMLYEIKWKSDFNLSLKRVLKRWQETSIFRSNQFNEDLSIISRLVNNKLKQSISLVGVYVLLENQSEKSAYKDIITQIANLHGKVKIHSIDQYSDVYEKFSANRIYHNFSTGSGILTNRPLKSKTVINLMKDALLINGVCSIGLQLMGGKISEINSDETAYVCRDAKFFIDIFSFWDSCVYQKENESWNSNAFKILHKENGPYVYAGFPKQKIPLENYYGDNLLRLQYIKNKYDPENILKFSGSL